MFGNIFSSGQKKRHAELARIIAYMGPALIVSVAYIDPGNFASDIESGASTGYALLWVVWLSGLFAMLMQFLSGKLGIVTGKSLPEMIRSSLLKTKYIVPYWLGAEAASAAVDLAEFLGTVIAINLLFHIPYLESSFIAVFDVFLLIFLSRWNFRRVEQLFLAFVATVSVGYLYETFLVGPNVTQVASASFIPSINSTLVVYAVSIIGATVMPHVLYLHSDLSRKKLKSDDVEEKRRTLKFHLIDTVFFLTAASFVNAAILIVASAGFFSRGLTFVSTINQAYHTLVPLFGPAAGYVFIAALLSSGISSSTTGTLAGQCVMEGLLGKKVNPWKRRIVTRVINVFPTTVAILLGLSPFFILFYSQVILSLMIPLPMIPLIYYTSRKKYMGQFRSGKFIMAASVATAACIISLNLYYLLTL
ncbi:MAG: Nramp family divalent metal transporter [Methanomassiliicoccales archaeon]